MSKPNNFSQLEELIHRWSQFRLRKQEPHSAATVKLDRELREEISILTTAGLAQDEAFLVAIKRMSKFDAATAEFASRYCTILWKQAGPAACPNDWNAQTKSSGFVAFVIAVLAAIAVKIPALFGVDLDDRNPADASFYVRNASFFVLPFLAGYFAWQRKITTRVILGLALAFIISAIFANIYPFKIGGSTLVLTAIHLPIILWLAVGVAYAGSRWRETHSRMNFIRFSGELFIYFVLIALGGGVFTGFLAMIFHSIGINAGPFIGSWLLPCGAAGAVIIGSWLVETKQNVMENMAPVLTRIFAPLFAAVLVVFLGTLLWTGRGVNLERELIIGFDLLLVVVLGLFVYSISARDPQSPPGPFDVVLVILLISALLADAVALWAIASRITDFGFTPNRLAALGENILLLINLAWSAILYIRFLFGRAPFTSLEKWQTDYLPVYAAWAALIVVAFPPLFGYK